MALARPSRASAPSSISPTEVEGALNARREAAREWYCGQFDVIEGDVFDQIEAIEARDPNGLVLLHESAMRKDAAPAARADASSRQLHRFGLSTASRDHTLFKAPHPYADFSDNSLSRGPMMVVVLAAFALACMLIGGALYSLAISVGVA